MVRPADDTARRVMFRSPSVEGGSSSARQIVDRIVQEMEEYDVSGDGSGITEEEEDDDEHGDEDNEEGEGEEDEEEEEDEDDEGQDEDDDNASATSSQVYDRESDPEGYASRLDELAGVLEMGQVELNAIKWGPVMGKQRDGEFKLLLLLHLLVLGM
jgi:hypothetical protein